MQWHCHTWLANGKLKWLQHQAPAGKADIGVFQQIQPHQGTMICLYLEGASQKVHSEGLSSQLIGETLLLNGRILGLPWQQRTAKAGNRVLLSQYILLAQHSSNPMVWCVSLKDEWLLEVWGLQKW